MNPACDFAFWKILGGRQLEPHEADALIKDREIGPLEGFRSKMGRPFSAKLKLTDANEVTFDFGNDTRHRRRRGAGLLGADAARRLSQVRIARVRTAQRLRVRKGRRRRTRPAISVPGRMILQRPIERAQMEKLLATSKTDLLQFVSARTRRPFRRFSSCRRTARSASNSRPKDPTKARARGGRPTTALKVLGAHPKTKAPVELHSGKYGPYVKHGAVNATLPDSEKAETLTLEEALEILAAKRASQPAVEKPNAPRRHRLKKAAKPEAAIPAAKPAAKRPAAKSTAAKTCREETRSEEAGREKARGERKPSRT